MVSEDDKLKVKKQTNDWAKVKVDGQTGYVSKDYAKVTYSFGKAKSMKQIQAEQEAKEAKKRAEEAARSKSEMNQYPQHQAVILLMMEQHLEVQQVPHRQQRKLPYPYHLVAHQQQEAGSQVMRSSLLEIHTDMVETA